MIQHRHILCNVTFWCYQCIFSKTCRAFFSRLSVRFMHLEKQWYHSMWSEPRINYQNKLPKIQKIKPRLVGGVRSMRLMRGGLGGDACSGTEIPTIIDPSATINYPSATGSIIVGISVRYAAGYVFLLTCNASKHQRYHHTRRNNITKKDECWAGWKRVGIGWSFCFINYSSFMIRC